MKKQIALKPYLQAITDHCGKLSEEELIDLVLGLAQDIPSPKRVEFLAKISSCSKGVVKVKIDKKILSQIKDLKERVDERIASIEDGSYYDDHDAWDEYDNDEDPDVLSEDDKEELEGFFNDVESIFLSGDLKSAREIYEVLFEFFSGTVEDYFTGVSEYDVDADFREERARYLRCVYETSESKKRVKEIIKAMNIQAPLSNHRFDSSNEKYPLLQDVVDAKLGDLPEWDNFLPEWKKALSKETSDRANILLMETELWLNGIKGVSALAKKWGKLQPRGYLFWLSILITKEDWKGVSKVAQEALKILPHGFFRAQACDMLVQAGQTLSDRSAVLKGKREKFYSLPGDKLLLVLVSEAEKQTKRDSELKKAKDFLEKEKKEALLIKILLMEGSLDEAFSCGKNIKPVGWTYGENSGGVLFGGVLAALTDCNPKAGVIKGLLSRYAENETSGYFSAEDDYLQNKKTTTASIEILKGLKGSAISEKDRTKYLSWAENIGKQRIDHIVSNKYRKAYRRAAEALGALAECFAVMGEKKKALDIIDEFRNRKYNRFPAFRGEVDSVTRGSNLL